MICRYLPLLLLVPLGCWGAKPKPKPAVDYLAKAQSEIADYRFDDAIESLDAYLARVAKTDADRDRANGLMTRAQQGSSMLDRVEKVQIIDSVSVPAATFWEAVRMSPSAGRLLSSGALDAVVSQEWRASHGSPKPSQPVYVTEDGEDVIWAGVDSKGQSTLYENIKLADGTWEEPRRLFDYWSAFGDLSGSRVDFPFLMSDGVTLYFAADGDQSLGGLDIFISRRDENGFLQPSNIGMPYNSPANDYLYAIDEQTGVGYWVTDRNAAPGHVTVYTFLPQEMRINYPVGDDNIVDLARVTSIRATQPEGADYHEIRQALTSMEQPTTSPQGQFQFALPGGRVLTRLEDFTPQGRKTMERYLNAQAMVKGTQAKITLLRRQYGQGDKSVRDEILRLEGDLDAARGQLARLSNEVVASETK